MYLHFEEENKRAKKKQIIISALWMLGLIAAAIVAAWLIVNFALKKVSVIGSSMESTICNGEDVLVNRTSYMIFNPSRDAIIAFYPTKDENMEEEYDDSSILIRRVVGLPGETILIKDGKIIIDGEEIEEDYKFDKIQSSGRAYKKIKLEDDEYFVLCDKRKDLDDSRSASFTKVKKENIIGSVVISLNPFSFVGGPTENKK